MQIQSTSPLAGTAGSTPASTGGAPSAAGAPPAPSESMFLQLLVAQLKHQDPTSPQDPTQFVSELAQFSELESVLGIQKDTDAFVQDANPAPATAPGTTPPAPTPAPNSTLSTKATTAA